jgi:WD40 repeat protein
MRDAEQPPPASVPRRFDVFLSYSSPDQAAVERVAEKLARAGLQPWFDKWCLTPGGRWQEELADGLGASSACAVFIGPADVGHWAREEVAVALDRAAKERSFRVFIALLPGLPDPFEPTTLSPFLSTRTWVDFRRGLDDTRALQAIINATKGVPVGPEVPIEPSEGVSPYRGLEAFGEEHAEFFFGREADVQRLVEKLKGSSFVAVVGPSGSGKSSLSRAGLVPALRRGAVPGSERWKIVVFRPGAHPLDALTGQLTFLYPDLAAARVRDQLAADARTLRLVCSRPPADGSRVLFLVDQCEEVFTLCHDEHERHTFLLNILHAAAGAGPSVVVPTLRADFYPRCAAYPELAQQLASHQFLVGGIGENGLRQVISEPARLVGLELEAGLLDTIVEDVEHQPGALPLLEHALLELWQRRRGRVLTLEAYQDTGGVAGALAKRADAILASFGSHEREIVRRVLLRLTQPGEGAEDTRRRAPMSELVTLRADRGAVETVVAALAESRLLTAGGDDHTSERVVEVSHEALIRGWPQLRSWVEEDRQGLRIHRRLTEAAHEWRSLGQDPGVLYRGARLAATREWADDHEVELNDLERDFLTASGAAEASELEAARRRARRLRALAFALAVSAAAAVILAVFALRSAREARTQGRIATSRALAVQAVAQLPRRPEQAMLLSLEAYERYPTPEARDAVVRAVQRTDGIARLWRAGEIDAVDVTFSPDGRLAAASGAGRISIWDLRTGRALGKQLTGGPDGRVEQLVFSPDGMTLAATGPDEDWDIWDVPSAELKPSAPLPGGAFGAIAFTSDSKRFAVISGDLAEDVSIIDVATGARRTVHEVVEEPFEVTFEEAEEIEVGGRRRGRGARRAARGSPGSLPDAQPLAVFSPDDRILATFTRKSSLSDEQELRLWTVDKRGLATRARCSLASAPAGPAVIVFADSGTLAWAAANGRLVLWDVRRCRLIGTRRAARPGSLTDIAVRADGELLASGDVDGRIKVWTVPGLVPADTSFDARGPVEGLTFAPDGQLVSSGAAGLVTLWDLSRAHDLQTPSPISVPEGGGVLAVSPDGRTVATVDFPAENIRLWDVSTRRHLSKQLPGGVETAAFAPNGRVLASGGYNGELRLWDVGTQQPLTQPVRAHDRAAVSSIAFRADGSALASAGEDGKIQIRDTRSLSELRQGIAAGTDSESLLAFSPDGTLITTRGGADARGRKGEILVFDPDTGKRSGGSMAVDGETIKSLAVSRDRQLLATGGIGSIRLWDLRTHRQLGEPLLIQTGQTVASLDFSADGRTLASTHSQKRTISTMMLWDVRDRRPIGEPQKGYDRVTFGRDGRALRSLGDAEIVLWDGITWSNDADAFRRRICPIVGRNLSRDEWAEFLPPREPYRQICEE